MIETKKEHEYKNTLLTIGVSIMFTSLAITGFYI